MSSYIDDVAHPKDENIGRTLGWASIAVAVAELAMPGAIEDLLGLEKGKHTGLLRVLGLRELLSGVDLLTHKDPAPGVLGRVAGDLLDGALLSIAATKTRNRSGFLAACGLVLPLVAADMYYAKELENRA